ncbi:hypothetical protein SLEP1_g58320 [Rubroshorea leprosula]|uniref:Uncharacterized protein n=1 Tax=Rubroshorea leprosula TaxID=152421 RepID=A0AAV5MRD0_9ROSI|nr:hypothetical protein SLEP1_g58320 [Rubroshorea leprosula]
MASVAKKELTWSAVFSSCDYAFCGLKAKADPDRRGDNSVGRLSVSESPICNAYCPYQDLLSNQSSFKTFSLTGAVQSISTRKGVETGSSKVPEDLSEAAGRVPKRVQVCCVDEDFSKIRFDGSDKTSYIVLSLTLDELELKTSAYYLDFLLLFLATALFLYHFRFPHFSYHEPRPKVALRRSRGGPSKVSSCSWRVSKDSRCFLAVRWLLAGMGRCQRFFIAKPLSPGGLYRRNSTFYTRKDQQSSPCLPSPLTRSLKASVNTVLGVLEWIAQVGGEASTYTCHS